MINIITLFTILSAFASTHALTTQSNGCKILDDRVRQGKYGCILEPVLDNTCCASAPCLGQNLKLVHERNSNEFFIVGVREPAELTIEDCTARVYDSLIVTGAALVEGVAVTHTSKGPVKARFRARCIDDTENGPLIPGGIKCVR